MHHRKILIFFIAASLSIAIALALLLFEGSLPFMMRKPSVEDVKRAEPAEKIPRIGVLARCTLAPTNFSTQGFRQALQELGYIEGKNVLLEVRNENWEAGQAKTSQADFDRLNDLAKELVGLEADVIVTFNTLSA